MQDFVYFIYLFTYLFIDILIRHRYEATDIGMHRSGLAACVIVGLPNVQDYIHKHREHLMEEKRQKLLALEYQQNQRIVQQQEQQGLLQDEADWE